MASNVVELERQVNKIQAEFTLDTWTTTDGVLRKSVDAFFQEAVRPDQYVRYLAERIYLDSLNSKSISAGIEQYLRHYIYEHFRHDKSRINQIDLICRDANVNQGNAISVDLAQLMSTQYIQAQSVTDEPPDSLDALKQTPVLLRHGDVVFLPRQADIIVVGDTHGDLASTQQIITKIKQTRHLERGGYVVFLGDYVHNGVKSWQNLHEILKLQRAHPSSIILLNGNHEFKESYQTALNEFLNKHWGRFATTELPEQLQDRLPDNGNHYGHMRLQLVRDFGFVEGERLYTDYANWGMGLPVACICDNVMISHSLGRREGVDLSLFDLLHSKQHDADNMQQLGFETWQTRRPSLHSVLVNNRLISTDLLRDFARIVDVNHFVVGHCHYRSGDTLRLGNTKITTIVSSSPFSPDAGHYMYEQMMLARERMRPIENLPEGDAVAGYLLFHKDQDGIRNMHLSINDDV